MSSALFGSRPVLAKAETRPLDVNVERASRVSSCLSKSRDETSRSKPFQKKTDIKRLVETKVMEGDLRNAARILFSSDTLAPHSDETLENLKKKHPSPQPTSLLPNLPPPSDSFFQIQDADTFSAIMSFPNGSAGGIDGITPQHLKDLVSTSAGDAGKDLLSNITKLCNIMLSGKVPLSILPYIYGARLCAFNKKDGGVRPIAIGCTFRRLTSKLACRRIAPPLSSKLQPLQLGFGSRGGCEAVVHSVRNFLKDDEAEVLLKVQNTMRAIWICLSLSVLSALCAAQPVDNPIILREAPAEILYRFSLDKQPPFVVECTTVYQTQEKLSYKWTRDGQPFDLASNPDIIQRVDEGSLVFSRPNPEDKGVYQCFVTTPLGVASTRPINVKQATLLYKRSEPVHHKPVEGRPYKLECPVASAYPAPNITWRSQLVSDPSISDDVRDKRITVGPDGTLYFANVTQKEVSDRFMYVCLAKTPAVEDEVTIASHFIDALTEDRQKKDNEVIEQYLSKDRTAKVGEQIYLYCIYAGNPLAHPEWYKDGTKIDNGPGERVTRYNRSAGKRLLIREVLPEDEGTYTCVADNEVGKVQNHTMKLTVVSAPIFKKKPERTMNAREGQDVTIPCAFTAIPAPTVSWTYNAAPIATNRITVTKTGLNIKKVQKSDTGYYGCSAKNTLGQEYAETLLVVA
ncbi:hemolin [Aphomia sociella]